MHHRLPFFILLLLGCGTGKGSVEICLTDDCTIEDSAESEPDTSIIDDYDEDGYSVQDGDCDDTNPNISPLGIDETVDGTDQDCDGIDGIDADGDGVASIESGGTDCDDSRIDVSPDIQEVCDSIDNNCDGLINNERQCTVYAHSEDTLYEVDPFALTLTAVTTVPLLYDFDTDMDGTLYGISPPYSIYMFDEITASWTSVATLNVNYGVLNGFCIDSANKMYATVGNSIYRIDATNGSASLIGYLGGGFFSSGDCVVDKTNGIYMTSTGSGGDSLVRINPLTGEGTLVGNTGVSGIYGLTSAWGKMFGFTGSGQLVEIDKDTGQAITLHSFSNISFLGAASSANR